MIFVKRSVLIQIQQQQKKQTQKTNRFEGKSKFSSNLLNTEFYLRFLSVSHIS